MRISAARRVQTSPQGAPVSRAHIRPTLHLASTRSADGRVTLFDPPNEPHTCANDPHYNYSIGYDAANHAIIAYDPESNAAYSDLDAAGKPRTRIDPNGNSTTYAYWDATRDGKLKSIAAPAIQSYTTGHALQYDYDANGNVISLTDIPAAGSGLANRTTTTQYDELNRPARITGPQYTDAAYGAVCPVTLYSYDTLSRRTGVNAGYTPSPCTNAASDITKAQETIAFDDFDRPIKRTDALGRYTTYAYDGNNNPLSVIDPKKPDNRLHLGHRPLVHEPHT